MARALELARETVNGVDGVDTEQTGAWFWEYGESAMRIRLEYHIDAIDRWKEVKDTVNRELQRSFEGADIELALPTQRIRIDEGGESR
jgi:MscS family membrane protein